MTDTITKPRVSAAAKTALVLAAAAVLLAVFALAAPGSRFFFPLVSLWCNLALFACVLLVLRVAGIKFDLFHKAVIRLFLEGGICPAQGRNLSWKQPSPALSAPSGCLICSGAQGCCPSCWGIP